MAEAHLDIYNQQYRFKVTVDGLDAANFREVEGLNVQLDVVEYYEGGENARHHKLIGGTRFSNIVLKRGTTDSKALFEWVKNTLSGKIERKNGSIEALNQAGESVARWDFKKAWPCRYEGPSFRGGTDEIAFELIELAHDGFEMA